MSKAPRPLSPFRVRPTPLKTLEAAAEAAADILAHLSFVDDCDAGYARAVELSLRAQLKKRGGK